MLPQELIDELNAAEALLTIAVTRDQEHADAASFLAAATLDERTATAAALAAHQTATTAASAVLAALKAHFGLS